MYDFKCISEYREKLSSEAILVKKFIENSEDGDCIQLPELTEVFTDFQNKLWEENPNIFLKEPLITTVFDQSERKYPSRASMLNSCPKAILISYVDGTLSNNVPKDNMRNKNAANMGTMLHEILQRYFSFFGLVEKENNKYLLEYPIVDDELCITGHCDFIGNFKSLYDIDCKFIGEIKTTGSYKNPYSGEHTHKIDRIIKQAHPEYEHLAQANFYMYELDLDFELFYYIDRGNTYLSTFFLYKKDKNFLKKIIKKLKYVKKYFINEKLPKPKSKSKKRCQYCNYLTICSDVDTFDDIRALVHE